MFVFVWFEFFCVTAASKAEVQNTPTIVIRGNQDSETHQFSGYITANKAISVTLTCLPTYLLT